MTDEAEIQKGIDRAYFVKKGMNRFNVWFARTRLICATEIEALFVNTPPYTRVKKNNAKIYMQVLSQKVQIIAPKLL